MTSRSGAAAPRNSRLVLGLWRCGSGLTSGRTSADTGERSDSLLAFVAVTAKWYFTLLVRPVK
ncbi:hypothetical protein ACKLTP_19240, partial [Paenarthrobacter ureafaciens]|uniref:hypothetical protein n=1 Tax=Paenarthrobacter ureafaciens TaxID=37931 RepID=UPI00397D5AC4